MCTYSASSGTTGTPTVIYQTMKDVDVAADTMARSLAAVGCTPDDICQNMMTYGLFTGGLCFHYGAEKLGMTVILYKLRKYIKANKIYA